MEGLNAILEVGIRCWGCIVRRALYIRDLPENLDTLRRSMEDLINLRQDVLDRVQSEELPQRSRRTHEVDGWLRSVQLMQTQVEEMLRNGDREIRNNCCLSGTCPKNCWSSYKLGKMVTKKITDVDDLRGKGRFDAVTHRLPSPPVEERPMGKTVGLDLMFQKVSSCLEDEQVSSIGLYGLGGVGKTTLLDKINNEYFGARTDFDVVIWVVVSKAVDIEKIQKAILKRLGIPDQELERKGKDEMKTEIWKLLKAKKFAILLDDMWGRVDLLEVGIPLTTKYSSKVVLTTRSERVCDDMQVDKRFRVECLTPDEAFSLFCDNVGANLLSSHPDMTRLARVIVEECRGLPLALVVIGRSMASRKTPEDWEGATQTLKTYPSLFPGMGDEVLRILKFSYDHLDNDTLKSCFRYCSLFPEDHQISNEELVYLWIGERFLDKFGDLDKAFNQGEEIIKSLKLACLLEGDVSAKTCKMHDVIRDMALWISCDLNAEEEHKVMVLDHVNSVGASEIAKWQEAERISLWSSDIELSLAPPCSFINLQTLILRESKMKSLPVGFFRNMPVIRVLDLSDNRRLKELPSEVFRLESLEYLDLTNTRIGEMPEELKNLTKLRFLIRHGEKLRLPPNAIPCLSNLQVLVGVLHPNIYNDDGFLEELERLQFLSDLGITLCQISSVKKVLVTSQKLQKCLRELEVKGVSGLKEVKLSLSTLQRLRVLKIVAVHDLEDVKIIDHHCISNLNLGNLIFVEITRCPRILNLTWLVYAPSLKILFVKNNDKMEEIIGAAVSSSSNNIVFSRLKELLLEKLPNLRSIYTGASPFPSLRRLVVCHCQNLRKLPLNSNTSLREIVGDSEWWEELEWEDDNLRDTLSLVFRGR